MYEGFLIENEIWDSYSPVQREELLNSIEGVSSIEIYSNQLWSELPLSIKELIGKKSSVRFWGLK